MKLHYYPETDSLYIELKNVPSVETREIVERLVVDLDHNGDVVGFDIDHASGKLDLSKVETIALPRRRHRSDPRAETGRKRSAAPAFPTAAKIPPPVSRPFHGGGSRLNPNNPADTAPYRPRASRLPRVRVQGRTSA